MRSTATTKTFIGEFGASGGRVIYTIAAPHGKVGIARKMWAALDNADASEQDSILARLEREGCATRTDVSCD